jgi:hypothetical protein
LSKYQDEVFSSVPVLLVIFCDREDDVKFCCALIGGVTIMLLPTTTIATKETVSVKVMPFIDLSDNDIYYLSKQENVNNNKNYYDFYFFSLLV